MEQKITDMKQKIKVDNSKLGHAICSFLEKDNDGAKSDVWGDRMLDLMYFQAKKINATCISVVFDDCSGVEGWGCYIRMFSPLHYVGWRKYSKKLGHWLLSL